MLRPMAKKFDSCHFEQDSKTDSELIDEDNGDKVIALRVKRYRVALGMTQSELAEVTYFQLRTIKRMESGDRCFRVWEIRRLATCLKVEIEDLIS